MSSITLQSMAGMYLMDGRDNDRIIIQEVRQ